VLLDVTDASVAAASKTAVNMITVQYAKAFPCMRINALEPGYTATDLNGHTGHPDRGAAR
jgi:NAD(P)-dependent dehydrogenase (short-subunit alcohol dehydrogenase family)